MAANRKARRESDPGLQPERTSLAWFRTLLGYGALMALAIKHSWHRAGLPFWLSLGVLAVVALILWRYTRQRNLMDVTRSDFAQLRAVRDKFLISLAVLSLALLFSVTHLRQLILFVQGLA
ncbi:DUF202 domain-containing protein [[Enterobacter] lignolyticus]|uniref:DUF202 domain-containing protein n=1 Tax=[Enterobacter] lignolyticus TaxID=1334193 RepID=A0A806XA07_9ENTR|nr:DUF202 domain-containing protein [[Enterobacter] lignolyticus]ALR78734.1 hypothetical protein AO703_21375 [[Enterobacter] lignolyticus]